MSATARRRAGRPGAGDAARDGRPGEVLSPEREVELSAGRSRLTLTVTNRSRRRVRVSSHYPFWQANPRLEFDRRAARGYRLDIAAGTSVRFEPGESREVRLVASLVEEGGQPG